MPQRQEPGPGEESVWDYPRPPALEPVDERIRVTFNGTLIADTTDAYRVLETSHPPVYYIPPEDIAREHVERQNRTSMCEFKGRAVYYSVTVGDRSVSEAAGERGFSAAAEVDGPEAHLVEADRTVNEPGDVVALTPPGDIHRVRNPGPGTAISIHVYGADIRELGSSIRRTYDLPVRAAD